MQDILDIKVKKLSSFAKIPTRTKESDAGYDLYACQRTFINPMDRLSVSVGISIEIPEGYYGRIAPRSGLALRHGIDVLAGVVDSGYRGELRVVLINLNLPEGQSSLQGLFGDKTRFQIKEGDRIAQLIIEKCHTVNFVESEALSDSDREGAGFGSSGK